MDEPLTTEKSPAVARGTVAFLKHKAEIARSFSRAQSTVYTYLQLQQAILRHRKDWHLRTLSATTIVELLLAESHLKVVDLTSDNYSSQQRFAWGTPSAFELALSLKPKSYLSHGTAAHLRGLLPEPPAVFYVNKEQSPKEQVGTLAQEGLDRAFSSRPRQANLAFADQDGHPFVVIAGKSTNCLGVGAVRGPAGERLLATSVERTLVDIAVRPIYCGGVGRVLEAYQAARHELSAKRLMATLKKLGHLYPYHQAIDFYLERAGFDGEALDLARRPGLELDFYLTHGMEDTVYDKGWRLHYPKGF